MTGNVVLLAVDVFRTKLGRKTRSLWGISWYHSVYNIIKEASHKSRSLTLCLRAWYAIPQGEG